MDDFLYIVAYVRYTLLPICRGGTTFPASSHLLSIHSSIHRPEVAAWASAKNCNNAATDTNLTLSERRIAC